MITAFEPNDPQKGAHRGVVYALAPSYTHPGTIWAGTDDGLMWITRDGGAHWSNITPPDLTPWSKISIIDASRFDDNTAYIAVNRFRLDDLHPWVYRTHDGGAHWTKITNGLPERRAGQRSARGSERSRSALRRQRGQRLRLVRRRRAVAVAAAESSAHVDARSRRARQRSRRRDARPRLLDSRRHRTATRARADAARGAARISLHRSLTYRVRRNTNTDTPLPPEEPHGTNPPDGAIFYYQLPTSAAHVAISIYDAHGTLVRRYSSDDPAPRPVEFDKPTYWERPFARPSTDAGMHRFVWDLREPTPESVAVDLPISANDEDTPRVPQGALVVPGHYTREAPDAVARSARNRCAY